MMLETCQTAGPVASPGPAAFFSLKDHKRYGNVFKISS